MRGILPFHWKIPLNPPEADKSPFKKGGRFGSIHFKGSFESPLFKGGLGGILEIKFRIAWKIIV